MEQLHQLWGTLDSFWKWFIPVLAAAIIGAMVRLLMSKSSKNNIKQKQKSGDNSTNVQIGNIEK